MVRLQPDMLAAVDKFVDEEGGITRPEAVRLILRRWLAENRMIGPAE
jgi:metal-responsive CopG/Arc/MetJ family transcriptional regulator